MHYRLRGPTLDIVTIDGTDDKPLPDIDIAENNVGNIETLLASGSQYLRRVVGGDILIGIEIIDDVILYIAFARTFPA